MSFKVSRVNQPEIITDSFLPLIQEVGELTEKDVTQILGEHNQISYDTDYGQLGEYIGLWKQVNDRFVYNLDSTQLATNRTERLFQLLGRLPHFRHWLHLKYHDNVTPRVEDVTIFDERNQGFLKRRLNMLENWDEHFERQAPRSMTKLIEEHLPPRIRVSDKFLFYHSRATYTKRAETRITLLVLFILAQNRGFGIDLDTVARALNVKRKIVDDTITGVFSPLAITVDTSDGAASLEASIQLTVTNPDPVEKRVRQLAGFEDIEATNSPDEYLGRVADALINQGLFTAARGNSGADESGIVWRRSDPSGRRYHDLPEPGSGSLFENIGSKSQFGGVVPIPTASFNELGTFNRAIGEALEAETYPEVGTTEWYLHTMIREPECVLGPAPIFATGKARRLGKIGGWLKSRDRPTRNSIIRTLLFLTHPAYRYVAIAACEFDKFSTKPPFEIGLHGGEVTLTQFFERLSEAENIGYEFILSDELRDADCRPVVDTAGWLGFISNNLTAVSYELGDPLNSAINEYKIADRVYEAELKKLRSVMPGVTQ